MRLNSIKAAEGSRPAGKRVGRGIGSGSGKTCGRGHKGQKSRAGGKVRIGFEGGQMPLQRRLPKIGFYSRQAAFVEEVRLYQLNAMSENEIDLDLLKKSGIVGRRTKKVKIINTGNIERAITVKGLAVTKGAAEAITSAGGKVE